jgi:NAD+ kinase
MSSSLPIRTVGLISRPRGSHIPSLLPPLFDWLEHRGIGVVYDEETANALPDPSKGKSRAGVADTCQLLLVLGGDGTLISAAGLAATRGIPILPVNMGSLGFLASFTLDELYPALENTLKGNFSVSERVMLYVDVQRGDKIIDTERVLNEVVINKGALARMIQLELSINSDFVCRYRADGMIVASPTGSTAYSLSAGGPIVHPAVEAFIITPICPHTLSDRPLVIPQSAFVEVRLAGQTESVFLTLDGQRGVPLESKDCVRISRAKESLRLIHPANKSYFEILRSKLKWGEA